MTDGIEIRSATAADADGIAVVHVAAWTETYAHLAPGEALARQSAEQRALRWREIIAGETRVAVAISGDEIVGFASSSAGHSDAPRPLELEAIYVLASHYGSGAGQRLLDAVIGEQPAYLWVAEDNPRARTFYSRNRFVADGTSDMHSIVGTPVRAIRMVR